MLGNGFKPQTLLPGLVLDGEAGPGKPQVAMGVAWSLGASPVRGGDESGGGDKRVFGAEGGRRGGCGVREFVTMKDVGALGGAWMSVLPGTLGHVGPETERSLVLDLSRSVGVEDLGFAVCE